MAFTFDQVLSICGCTKKQLRYWKETGLVKPSLDGAYTDSSPLYSFQDLVELKTIKRMLEEGISLQKIRRTLDYIYSATNIERPLSQCKLITDGSTIFQMCGSDGELIDTLKRGQFAFCIGLDSITLELDARVQELASDREVFIQTLLAGEDGQAAYSQAG